MQKRAMVMVLGASVAVVLAILLYQSGPRAHWLPPCLFHRLSGLHCPGCGMTRASYAALHGHFATAFRFNPLGMILFPLAVVALGVDAIAWVMGRPLPISLRVGGRWAWGVLAVILGFWVLRNIPLWPCTLLAPP